jgi:hypothetical protein
MKNLHGHDAMASPKASYRCATQAFKGGYEGRAVWRFSWDSAVYYMADCATQALRVMRDRCSRAVSQV